MIPIVLLLGTSTAGKTSICNNSAFDDFEKIGVDLAFRDPKVLQPAVKAAILEILNKYPNTNIAKVIREKIKLNSTLELIAKEFANYMIPNENYILPNDDASFQNTIAIYKEFIEILNKDDLIDVVFGKTLDKSLFMTALLNASQGQPTIIDMVPNSYYNIMDLFKKVLVKYNYAGTTVILHCSLSTLSLRIDERNFTAKQNSNKNLDERKDIANMIGFGSIVNWSHVNLHGEYDFVDYASNDEQFNIKEILNLKVA